MEHLFCMMGVDPGVAAKVRERLAVETKALGCTCHDEFSHGACTLFYFDSAPPRCARMWHDASHACAWLGHVVHDALPLWPGAEAIARIADGDVAMLLPDLDGVYLLADYDGERGALTLGADRMGLHPCYTFACAGGWLFSSSLHLLIRCAPGPLVLDARGMAEYAYFRYCLDDLTFVRGIRRLAPGTRLTLTDTGGVRQDVYFDGCAPEGSIITSHDAAVDALLPALLRSVQRRAPETHDLVCLLSGGDDSRMIVAALARLGLPFTTWTTDPDDPWTDDIDAARMVADRLGVENRFTPIGTDYIQRCWRERAIVQDFESAMGNWLIPLSRGPSRHGCIFLEGFGGNPIFRRGRRRERETAWLRDGRVDDVLEEILLTEGRGDVVPSALTPNYREAWSDWQREAVRRLLTDVCDRDDPFFWFNLLYRSRRGVAIALLRAIGTSGADVPVFLDHELFDIVLRVHPSLRCGHRLQRAITRQLCPELDGIPYKGDRPWPAACARHRRSVYGTTTPGPLRNCFVEIERSLDVWPELISRDWLTETARAIEGTPRSRASVFASVTILADLALWARTYGDRVSLDLEIS